MVLLSSTQLALGAATPRMFNRRGVSPSYPADDMATEYCSWWHNYDDKIPCDELLSDNHITLEQFPRWVSII